MSAADCPCGGEVAMHDNNRLDGSGETVAKCKACGRREVLRSWKNFPSHEISDLFSVPSHLIEKL